jgi:hypothetical protein
MSVPSRLCRKDLNVFATKLLRAILLISLVALVSAHAAAQSRTNDDGLLPEKVGDFGARAKTAQSVRGVAPLRPFRPEDFAVAAQDERTYAGAGDTLFFVRAVKTSSTSAAFSLLGHLTDDEGRSKAGVVDGLGLFGVAVEGRVMFIKGDAFVDVQDISERAKSPETLRAFTKALADALTGEAAFVPVLALHLPDSDKKLADGIGYAVSLPVLQQEAGARPVLDAVSFDESTEAVTAKYGDARLVVVEFPTPQHAFDADASINKRIAELSAAGQPVPSSYKRVGNYSVFVFDAPDGLAAEKLVSGVKYEKDVRWLGRNPHAEEIATRAYTSTMGGVILTTVITTGLAILLCLTVGGLIGGAIFLSRRAKHAAQEIYSDAGGMLRLNLEDLNTPPSTTKMLGRGED